MSYISVAEEEGGEPIELPAEDDGTGCSKLYSKLPIMIRFIATPFLSEDIGKPRVPCRIL